MTTDTVPTWAIHRRLYEWILGFSRTPIAPVVLLVTSVIEAFIPFVPPDVLLVPMCLENRRKSALYAVIAIVGSLAGAMVGYFVIASFVAGGSEWIFGEEAINSIIAEFDKRGSAYVFVAALTPIPFFVLTTAAGVAELNFGLFLAACVVGRTLRYGIEAFIVWWIGAAAKMFIERWFNLITILMCILVVVGWVIMTLIKS